MSKIIGHKKRIIVTTAAMLAIGGGAAFAYWSAAGTSNTTTTAAAAAENFTVISSVAGTALSPGSAAQTVTFTVTNDSDGGQRLANVAVSVANVTGGAWTAVAGCSAADFTVGSPLVDGAPFAATEIAAGDSVTGTVTLQMNNRVGVDQNGCKNAAVPLHVAAS
ncbi:hypothetical protein AU252_15770 [Pseudarthrobacter sulfonivorans]|uniref:Uncharacterized protein n=1 Tax=Pseudarthrobacter sulfonivorans TaxID=121292 RepID=A0A0U3FFB8_9MICC|nr:hypothetical protein [Pseudarthrobacter sulfonivorans]ALV42425.1 hypothetical protein AU252_15770 [Pseudarthrobacter sulfonivorans]